jgi:hypothetical protein
MKIKYFLVVLSDCALYLIEFIILPAIDNDLVEGNFGLSVMAFTTSIITIIGMLVFSDKFRWWLISIVLYFVLMAIYIPNWSYNIDPYYKVLGIPILAIFNLTLQFCIWCIVKIVKAIARAIKKRKN